VTSALSLDAVSKRRRGRAVLREVSLRVSPGEAVLVTGANGAGKTTLLRIIAGVSFADSGRLVAPRPVAMVPAHVTPPARWTTRGYLTALARLRGVSAEPARLQEFAHVLGVDDVLDERLPDLSHGTLRKVVLLEAFLAEPALLVLDEPLTGLDDSATAGLAALLADARATGAVVVVAEPGRWPALRPTGVHVLADGRLGRAERAPEPAGRRPGLRPVRRAW
jgi:ABC-type multidrug transport system ATPase subunit